MMVVPIIKKVHPYQRFWASDVFRFHPHPFRMRLKPEGLSHGLKTVHRTVFTAADAAAALSSSLSSIKISATPKGVTDILVHQGNPNPNEVPVVEHIQL